MKNISYHKVNPAIRLIAGVAILITFFISGSLPVQSQVINHRPLTQVDLPVTFDDASVNYDLIDFGGTASVIQVDPVAPPNSVCKTIKGNTAETWAGTTIGGTAGFANVVPFAPGATTMTMRVYSPDAGIPVRMKVEDPNDPTKSVETQVLTTTSNAWETLTFDFANQAPGTAAINYSYIYKKLSVFFNFGTTGAIAGTKTYYFDDIAFGGTAPGSILVTFQVLNPDSVPVYVFGSWTNWGNWPGDPMTSIGNGYYTVNLPFPANSSHEFLFVNGTNPVKEVLNPAWSCTNGNATYTNRVITLGPADTLICFKWDSCTQCNVPSQTQVNLPVTFDDSNVNYALVDFGGNASNIENDPLLPSNKVCKVIKSNTAELWAGTTIGGTAGFAAAIPFAAGSTIMTMSVYSPDSGIPVRMKVEDPNDPTKSVETEDMTTTSNAWETLVFDFANQAAGTAAINFGYTYKKLSVFFNFGITGAIAGTKTYFFDNVAFGFPVTTGTIAGDEIKVNLSQAGLRIFSNTISGVDQISVFDIMGRSVYSSGGKSDVNTLIPMWLNSGSFYIIKIKVKDQVATFKGLLVN
jgi:hypothetical protein